MRNLHITLLLLLSCATLNAQDISGAWKRNLDTAVQYLTLVDHYFVLTTFDLNEKKFYYTRGGTANLNGKFMTGVIEFNTLNKSEVKSTYSYEYSFAKKDLNIAFNGNTTSWTWVDDGQVGLAGYWRITGRMQDGNIVKMNPGARKTIKTLSGSRFQWTAINTETGEFFGTGGGQYTFKDGKYTEHIEFFSRDSSRVGSSLTFDAELKNGDWHHSGKSSKGDPIYEVWSRR